MSAAAAEALLEVDGVTVTFGGIVALDNVSFDIRRGEILGLIGPNGAGKTTLFNCLSRLYTYESGEIRFEGKAVRQGSPHKMAEIGMGRTFQNLALFGTMTVLQNVMIGGHCRTRSGFLANALRLPWVGREEADLRARAMDLLTYLDLEPLAGVPIVALPFGTQKRVELARALAGEPKLLLLDEPAGGLNHAEVDALGDLIREIRDTRDVTVLLVEHHMSLVMRVSDTVVALDFGRKIAQGTPDEVQQDEEVISAYLGTTH